jgi:hypothetical protein
VRKLCQNSVSSDREPTLESLWCIGILACRDTRDITSDWLTYHSKSFIRLSYGIWAFTYRIVGLVFVLSYIWSHVWGSIEYSGTRCGDCSLCIVYAHGAPAIQIVVVPAGVTTLLGLCSPPRSYVISVGPTIPGVTIDPCVDSLLCYWLIRRPKSILQDSPKIYGTCAHLYNYIWVVLLVHRLNLAFLSPKISHGIAKVLVCLCLYGFNNPTNTLRWKLLLLVSVCLWIILLGLWTANKLSSTIAGDSYARLVFLS